MKGFIQNRSVWPTLFLLNVFTALKGTNLYIFTMYGHGGHLGHVTSIILMDFYFHVPKGLHTNFGKNGPVVSEKSIFLIFLIHKWPWAKVKI